MAFRDLIFHNFRRKVFSLLLAILIWMTIHYADSRHRTSASIPVLTNSPGIYP
jgi:hypothetical protein